MNLGACSVQRWGRVMDLLTGKEPEGDSLRRKTVVNRMQNHRRWCRTVYGYAKKCFQPSSEQPQFNLVSHSAHIKWERPEYDESWQRYTSQYPWARIVPIIISLTRWSHTECLDKEVYPQHQESGGKEDSGDIECDDIRWKDWATKKELSDSVTTGVEVESWWNELNMRNRIHYLIHIQ